MKNSTILIAISINADMGDLSKKLESIREIPARAAIVVVGDAPPFPYFAYGVSPYGMTDVPAGWSEDINTGVAALKTKSAEIETMLEAHNVSGDVSTVFAEPIVMAQTVARRALLADLVMIGNDLRDSDILFRHTVHSVLFESPVGALVNDDQGRVVQGPARVFLAWNGEIQSARAAHLALPYLRKAKEVIVAIIDPVAVKPGEGNDPGVDLASWLTHHGCTVDVRQYPSGGQSIGDCILDRARESGADLIVMGGYGHSRTREALFGGTTRALIEQTRQAVFLAH